MTFSIVARCAETGMFGIAISSSSPAVAARCSYARAGVGAVASQNVTDPRLGPWALDLMEKGCTPTEAVEIVSRHADHADYRQVSAVGHYGGAAVFSGPKSLGINGSSVSKECACAGNLLAGIDVLKAMDESFRISSGHLGDRLIAAMQAGLAAGGEEGPVHSAGMKLVRDVPWPVADLRIDWTEDCPIAALADRMGGLQAPARRLRHPGAEPGSGPELRRPGGRGMKDIAIVGAGVLGAAIGWRLAGAGHRVTLFDPTPGGSPRPDPSPG